MKIIIDNRSVLHNAEALLYVREVMKDQRINDEDYCPATTFGGRVAVWVFENKTSIRFVVQDLNKGV